MSGFANISLAMAKAGAASVPTMLVGSAGSNLYRSTDLGSSWSTITFPSSTGIARLVWLPPQSRWIAVLSSGDYYYSDDNGDNWSAGSAPWSVGAGTFFKGLLYVADLGLLIGGSFINASNNIYWSTDGGDNWTQGSITGFNLLTSNIAYSPDAGVVLAIGDGSISSSSAAYSADGKNWTSVGYNFAVANIFDLTYDDVNNVFMVETNFNFTSADGQLPWPANANGGATNNPFYTAQKPGGVVFSPLKTSTTGTPPIGRYTSDAGSTWNNSTTTIAAASHQFKDCAFWVAANKFFLVGTAVAYQSADGDTWSTLGAPLSSANCTAIGIREG